MTPTEPVKVPKVWTVSFLTPTGSPEPTGGISVSSRKVEAKLTPASPKIANRLPKVFSRPAKTVPPFEVSWALCPMKFGKGWGVETASLEVSVRWWSYDPPR